MLWLVSKARGLGVGVALVAAALALGAGASAQAASLKAPKSVSVGKKVVLEVAGFPPSSAVTFTASLDGPAALSGRALGRVRTNGSGRATLRTRFPSTYKWCDADRKCSTYKWPTGARIALSAQAKKPPHTFARKVVPLKKRGQKRAGYRRCGGKVRLSAGDRALHIKAKGMGCRKAKRVIKAPASELGYRCATKTKGGLPRITCTKGRRGVKFTYVQF